MKLVSIDIETTGLDPSTCSILEVGAVIFDPQPELVKDGHVNEAGRRPATFECLIKHSRIQGEPYALQLNSDIIAELAGVKKTHLPILTASQFTHKFGQWIVEHADGNKLNPAGKNYASFDQQFLQRMPGWDAMVKPHLDFRCVDVGSLYFNPSDGKVLGLAKCLERIGCSGDAVTHRALDDALAVMTAITRFFN